MSKTAQRLLAAYACIVSSILLFVLFQGGPFHKPTSFDEITVERINLVEADGTLRMAISNHDRVGKAMELLLCSWLNALRRGEAARFFTRMSIRPPCASTRSAVSSVMAIVWRPLIMYQCKNCSSGGDA